MKDHKVSPSVDAILIGCCLPVAVLLGALSVPTHFHFCEWRTPLNSSARQPERDTRLVFWIHGKEAFRYFDESGRRRYHTVGAVVMGLILPGCMFFAGAFWAIIICKCFHRRQVDDGALYQVMGIVVPRPKDSMLQFSLLALLLFTTTVAVVMSVYISFFRR